MACTHLALISALSLSVAGACNGSEDCGPGEASGVLSGSMGETTLEWTDVRASPNNDCSSEDGPVSLTLEATQSGGDKLLVLCLPRPDRLNGEVTLPDDDLAQVIAVLADDGDCLISLDPSRDESGTITFSGVCDDGVHEDGFAMEMNASFPVTVACDGEDATEDTVQVTGTVAVTATML